MPARKPTKEELESYRSGLRHLLQELTGDIDKLAEETLEQETSSGDVVEEGSTDGYAREVSLGLMEQDEHIVRDVMDALDRLKEGTFGACEGCEAWIPKPRLKALPYARNCISCQQELENGGGY